jgi:hypothetical protein
MSLKLTNTFFEYSSYLSGSRLQYHQLKIGVMFQTGYDTLVM